MSGVDYGREALDFIEGLNGHTEVSAAMDALERAFCRFGFETIIVTGLPNPDQNFSQMVLAKRWPAGWFKLYTENNFDRVDPVVRHCRRSIHPFEWSEAPYNPVRERGAAEVMRRAADFRMQRGFIVPIHGLTGYEAAVSLGGVDLDLNVRSKPALHLMAMYSFDRIRSLLDARSAVAAYATGMRGGDLGIARQIGVGDRRNLAHYSADCRAAFGKRSQQARRS